jgi:hypothetical protein
MNSNPIREQLIKSGLVRSTAGTVNKTAAKKLRRKAIPVIPQQVNEIMRGGKK